MKKFTFFCLIILFFSALSFPALKVSSAEPIKIGLFFPESGPFAVFGKDIRDAAKLAVREINAAGGIFDVTLTRKRPLKVIEYDTTQGPVAAVTAARKALQVEKVSALIGDLSYPNTRALMDVALSRKVPLVSYGATALMPYKYKNPYFFKISPGVPNYVSALAGYASRVLNVKKFGLLVSNDLTGISYSNATGDFLKALGLGSIVVEERFPKGTKDFAGYLTTIKKSNPDGLVFVAPPAEAGLIVSKAREIGLNKPIFTFEKFIVPKMFLESSGGRTEDIFMCSAYKPGVFTNKSALAFTDLWKQAYLSPPSGISAIVYDSVKMLASVMEKHGTDSEKIKSGLGQLKKYDGASGDFSFLPTGSIVKNMVITRWEKNEIVPVLVYEYTAKEREFVDSQETEGPMEKD